MVSKIFKKVVNDSLADDLEKCGFFSDFQYGVKSSRSTADLLTIYLIGLLGLLIGLGLLELLHVKYSSLSTGFGLLVSLRKLKSYGISGRVFGFNSPYLSSRRLRVVLDGTSLQKYPVNARAPQVFILGPTLFLLCINDLPDDVVCNVVIYGDDGTFHCKCEQSFDL